jgi:hypothetical protein
LFFGFPSLACGRQCHLRALHDHPPHSHERI